MVNTMAENRKRISEIQVGDRVAIRYTVGIRDKAERLKVATVTKITTAAIYADNMRFSKTTLRGLDRNDHYTLMGSATPEEIAAHEQE
jgi:hypothetical protein